MIVLFFFDVSVCEMFPALFVVAVRKTKVGFLFRIERAGLDIVDAKHFEHRDIEPLVVDIRFFAACAADERPGIDAQILSHLFDLVDHFHADFQRVHQNGGRKEGSRVFGIELVFHEKLVHGMVCDGLGRSFPAGMDGANAWPGLVAQQDADTIGCEHADQDAWLACVYGIDVHDARVFVESAFSFVVLRDLDAPVRMLLPWQCPVFEGYFGFLAEGLSVFHDLFGIDADMERHIVVLGGVFVFERDGPVYIRIDEFDLFHKISFYSFACLR